MAEASAADGKMKDLKISETKKKKDGNPKTAAKKPQQQKKKVGLPPRVCLGQRTRC
jgi:prolyl-tRNA synthetase